MNLRLTTKLVQGFQILLIVVAGFYVLVYLWLALFRIWYPFELEWMEGGSLVEVNRILHGQPVYAAPTTQAVAYIYTPLYFYLSAAVSAVLGFGFAPLRLISFFSTLGCFGLIFLFVRRETSNNLAAWGAVGLYAATFRLSGAWFDIARVDDLGLFLVLTTLYLIRFYSSVKVYIGVAGLIALVFLTKQTALTMIVPVFLYCLVTNWRRGLLLAGAAGSLIGASTLLFNFLTGGWYSYYVFELPKQHKLTTLYLVDFWRNDILASLWPVVILSMVGIVAAFRLSQNRGGLFYFLMCAGLIGQSWLSSLNIGSFNNVLLSAYASLAIVGGLGLAYSLKLLETLPLPRANAVKIGLLAACLFQFWLLIYDFGAQVPTANDLAAGQSVLATVSRMPGEVFMPYSCYLTVLAGKEVSCAHQVALSELSGGFGGNPDPQGEPVITQIKQNIVNHKYSAIIIKQSEPVFFQAELDQYYTPKLHLLPDSKVFYPVTGYLTRPDTVYVPKDQP